jgi:hypothetical protein
VITYHQDDKSGRTRWEYVERTVTIKNPHRNLVVKPENERPLEGPRRGWEDNIKTDLKNLNMRA